MIPILGVVLRLSEQQPTHSTGPIRRIVFGPKLRSDTEEADGLDELRHEQRP